MQFTSNSPLTDKTRRVQVAHSDMIPPRRGNPVDAMSNGVFEDMLAVIPLPATIKEA